MKGPSTDEDGVPTGGSQPGTESTLNPNPSGQVGDDGVNSAGYESGVEGRVESKDKRFSA